ncbi:hypothetical protein LZ31DRAFT_355505 [Colletotrichum somersetense]|nr:hypothetical protein LZ31DRAFT_355505 [Colletotrichum somersetense]
MHAIVRTSLGFFHPKIHGACQDMTAVPDASSAAVITNGCSERDSNDISHQSHTMGFADSSTPFSSYVFFLPRRLAKVASQAYQSLVPYFVCYPLSPHPPLATMISPPSNQPLFSSHFFPGTAHGTQPLRVPFPISPSHGPPYHDAPLWTQPARIGDCCF